MLLFIILQIYTGILLNYGRFSVILTKRVFFAGLSTINIGTDGALPMFGRNNASGTGDGPGQNILLK